MSYSKKVVETRDVLLEVVQHYLACARGITDLETEGDFDDLQSAIDGLLEDTVAQFKSD